MHPIAETEKRIRVEFWGTRRAIAAPGPARRIMGGTSRAFRSGWSRVRSLSWTASPGTRTNPETKDGLVNSPTALSSLRLRRKSSRETPMDLKVQYREFLKDTIRKRIDFSQTDQNQGIPAPPIEKPYASDARRIDLIRPGEWKTMPSCDLAAAIGNRRSRRSFLLDPLTLDELSFLLWATQGLVSKASGGHALRTTPSAGCRHALETYLLAIRVESLIPGVYRYLPLSHQLLYEFSEEHLGEKLAEAAFHQNFAGRAAATFIWAAVPYRMEWRYGLASYKVIALEAGHICQNLYLACEAIGAGTCAIAAYDQQKIDALLRLDGDEEFAIYLAPIGHRI
jgi:SagB-type dehydrogenase family enzyme